MKNDFTSLLLELFNKQSEFIKICIYVMAGFIIILAGYGVGRFVGRLVF